MIYTIGSIAVSGNTLTGTGTGFKAPLSMIRVGCTVIVKSNPIQIFSITEIVSDTELSVTPAASPDIPAGTAYSILLSDSISVDGLAQDVAETLRYYQGQETEIASAIEIMKSLSEGIDLEALSNTLQTIQEETARSTANAQQTEANKEITEAAAIRAEDAATSASGSATSATNAAASASTSASAATTKANEASESAENAANSASSASASKDAAAASARDASTSETNAEASKTAAASSASSAATSASTATTKASEAATSASNASKSASAASTSATNAAKSATDAKSYLDQITGASTTTDLSKVSGVLDIAHGGTGQSTEAGLKSYLEGLGIGTSSGTSIELPLSIDKGGTGATTAATAWTALGGGTIGKLNNVSLTANVTGTLPIANGGTGATTANAAWTALGGGSIGKLNSISLTANVSGTLPVANGGTGQTTNEGVKSFIESLGFSVSGGGAVSNHYEINQSTFDFAAPTCGITFASYSGMSNMPTNEYLNAVLLGDANEDIDTITAAKSFAILECVKISATDGSTVYSLRVTRVPYKSTYTNFSAHARCYGIGVVGTGGSISWGFRQDYW